MGDRLPKSVKTTDTADLVSEAAIRDRAYHLWEAAGRPDGNAEHFWYQAHHEATAELTGRAKDGSAKTLEGKLIHSDPPKSADPKKAPRAAKPKKVADEAKPAKKATKHRAAGVATTH